MRRLLIAGLVAATMAPALASAQPPELRHDRQDLREQQRDLLDAERYGDRHDVRDARRDVRDSRAEYREDWRDYRRENGDAFRPGRYVGPRAGWRYRPVAIGTRFEPGFYDRRYWIADPYRYRLPRPSGYQRWVRYGNDVVLVNVRTGVVRQVYNGFFY